MVEWVAVGREGRRDEEERERERERAREREREGRDLQRVMEPLGELVECVVIGRKGERDREREREREGERERERAIALVSTW